MSRPRKAAAFLLVALLVPLLATGGPATVRQPRAVRGVLDMPPGYAEPVALEGQWGFAWEQFVDAGWQEMPAQAFAPVPSSWNELPGKPRGENGWGSYLLQVNCPAGQSLAVEAVGQRTASRLFVNGVPAALHGQPGPGPRASSAAVHSRIPITREFPCPLRLTLHVSNFDHRGGGMVRPLVAGSRDALERRRESQVLQGAALLTVYLLTGAVALIFHAVRRRERVPLLFGLFCVAMAVYTDMIGERLLLRPLAPQVSWFAYMRVEYLSWIAAMALFVLTLRALFPVEIHRRVAHAVLAALGVGAAATLALPPGVYSWIAPPGQAIAVAALAYIAVALLRAVRRTGVDAQILLAGMVAVLATQAIDLLRIDAPVPDRKFGPFGFALFLLAPAVVIARRMSAALNAAERNRALEENARLREDVERISRHDMKTPLNGILGAARLLADDRRLAGDQRELVGLLQRAGLRLLEMVNLSLDLFRMETGSYTPQPQAVDLRDLVSRVLVDLHAYAEERQVALHWYPSGSAPPPVRGEELLCYSIVANLVKNAIEAAGAGRQVAITLRPGDPVLLTVHNPGEVPPEIAARFFEKYVSGRRSGGTGLGTYSALLMAQAQQGDLRMHTGPAGTVLALTLPALKEPLPPPRSAAPREDAQSWLQGLPLREVLLVDDDEFTRLVTRRLLPDPPFRVETAADGQAVVEAMGTRWPDYLLVDMDMPRKNGVETVRWVRGQEIARGRARCRIVMLSGNDGEDAAATALAAGADRFLVKPVSRERLLSALRALERQPDAADAAPPQPAATPGGDHVVVNAEWRAVFPGFLKLQQEAVEHMARALAAGQHEELRFLAHRAHGALSAMGLEWASQQSRIVAREALAGEPAAIAPRIAALREHLARVEVTYR
jgi:signal transduction histidine kinase/DNA-binding response OmpR family regulator